MLYIRNACGRINKKQVWGVFLVEIQNSSVDKEILRETEVSLEEKRDRLYHEQINTLNEFLKRNAITKEQYEKGIAALQKMKSE